MALKVILVPVTPFEQNCSILICDQTQRAVVTDPGGDIERIIQAIQNAAVHVEAIWLTHGHIDHCAGATALAKALGGLKIIGPHADEKFWLDQLPIQSQRFGFPHSDAFEPDQWLNDGDEVQVGHEVFQVIHCPGHTPGHVVFVNLTAQVAIVGDVLFAGSIGRTDFPRGNHRDLIRSIQEKLFPLGDDIAFVPGHGPTSTFGYERHNNPYVS
jgi:glyoxylase-like metal-dependent hydrolase (beta-lactamase superfamily II)